MISNKHAASRVDNLSENEQQPFSDQQPCVIAHVSEQRCIRTLMVLTYYTTLGIDIMAGALTRETTITHRPLSRSGLGVLRPSWAI